MEKRLRTWIEVSKSALRHNYRIFRGLIPHSTKLMAVAKSNAYGHNIYDFARFMQKLGADWIGVDSIVEAIALRDNHIRKPILILGYTLPSRYKEALDANVSVTISNLQALRQAMKFDGLKIHIKIDTGMHRQGFFLKDLPEAIKILKRSTLRVEGIYTHFPAAKNPAFPQETRTQIELFKRAVGLFHEAGFKPIRHTAATSGTIVFPESHFDMVRVGIGMYGLWPSKEVEAGFRRRVKLHPVLSWKTVLGEVKTLQKGDRVGYDLTEKVNKKTLVGVCPVGYWHGYPRALSSIGRVLVKGGMAKILGRVSMDMIVVDLSGIKNARAGDLVTLLGRDGKEEVSADELADLSGTINYEVVTRINPLIERIYK